jgi:hypothetical protein
VEQRVQPVRAHLAQELRGLADGPHPTAGRQPSFCQRSVSAGFRRNERNDDPGFANLADPP